MIPEKAWIQHKNLCMLLGVPAIYIHNNRKTCDIRWTCARGISLNKLGWNKLYDLADKFYIPKSKINFYINNTTGYITKMPIKVGVYVFNEATKILNDKRYLIQHTQAGVVKE